MLHVAAVALALTLVPSAPASAPAAQAGPQAPPASAAKPSPAAERVARALTTQPNWNETIGAYASSLASQIEGALRSQGGEPPKDVEKRVKSGLDGAVGYEEVVRLQAQALAGRFSEDELRTIQKFYESGPGKKLVSELPAVSRQVIEVVQHRISAAIPRIVQEVAPSLARAKSGSTDEGSAGHAPDGAKDSPAQGRKPPAQTPPPRP
jgi:hypothetical protein